MQIFHKIGVAVLHTRPPHVQAPTGFIFLSLASGTRLPCLHQRCYLHLFPCYYVMASLFSKRLTCFYCGQRSARSHRGPIRNFRCEHCEADNFFDEVDSLSLRIYLYYTNYRSPNRKEKLQIHRLWSPTLKPTRLAHQNRPSNQQISVDPSHFAPNVLGISIYSRAHWPPTSRLQTIPPIANTNAGMRSSAEA